MKYQFDDLENQKNLSIEQNHFETIGITIVNEATYERSYITLNQDQIYDLIGCLHSLQAKIKKGGNNGTSSAK